MAVIDQSSVLGMGIPKAYIRQIVLEGATGSPKERNPHIEIDSKVRTVRRNLQPSPLTIKVHLALKDQIDKINGKGTWITNKKLLTYMKLEILVTTDRDIAEYIITNNTTPIDELLELRGGFWNSAGFIRNFQRSALYTDAHDDSYFKKETISVRENDIVGELAQPGAVEIVGHVEVYGTQYAIAREALKKTPNYTTDDAGNVVYDILYKRNFIFNTLEPEYLAVLAIVDLDITKMEEDFRVQFPSTYIAPRQLVVETVIDNSEVISTASVLYDNEGKVWNGPIHAMPSGRWMKGVAHKDDTASTDYLTMATVPNHKIRDTRSLRQERLQLEIETGVEGTPFNLFKHLRSNKFNINETSTYFTAEMPARDSRGNSRFFFMFDMMKFAKERSRYGYLYNDRGTPNDASMDDLLSMLKINDFRITRKRVNRDGTVFNELEPEHVVISTKEDNAGRLIQKVGSFGSISEVSIAMPINRATEARGCRYFTGVDKEMELITDGFYVYGVEMVIEDNTADFLKRRAERIRTLLDGRGGLREYYNKGTVIDRTFITSNGTKERVLGTYDPVYDRFTKKFIDEVGRGTGLPTKQTDLLQEWLRTLSMVQKFESAAQERAFGKYVMNILNTIVPIAAPKTGNPQGVQTYIRLIENFLSEFESIIGIRTAGRRGPTSTLPASVLMGGNQPSNTRKRTIKYKMFLPHITKFDSNFPKSTGYDYLSNGPLEPETNHRGLKVVSSPALRRRIELETEKYYTRSGEGVVISPFFQAQNLSAQAYSYLTPSNVSLFNESYSLVNELPIWERFTDLGKKIQRYNDYKKNGVMISTSFSQDKLVKAIPPSQGFKTAAISATDETKIIQDSIANNLIDILAEKGITIVTATDQETSTFNAMSAMSAFPKTGIQNETEATIAQEVINNKLPAMAVSTYLDIALPHRPSPARRSLGIYDLTNFRSSRREMAEGILVGTERIFKKDYDALPNQIKSLFIGSSDPELVLNNWVAKEKALGVTNLMESGKASSYFDLNYKRIMKIEVFKGFRKDADNQRMLNSPIWDNLQKSDVDSLPSGQRLLCRMVSYNNQTLGLDPDNDNMHLPTYNRYFMVSPTAAAPRITTRYMLSLQEQFAQRIASITAVERKVSIPTPEPEYTVANLAVAARISAATNSNRRSIPPVQAGRFQAPSVAAPTPSSAGAAPRVANAPPGMPSGRTGRTGGTGGGRGAY